MRSFARSLTIERLTVWVLFILLFAMAVRVPVDTDTWWHLRSGEIMLDEGVILREDRFSHPLAGEDWINHSWLAQIIMAGMYRSTGGDGEIHQGVFGLALFTALLGTAGMGLVYRMCRGNVYSKAFVMVFGAATAAVFWSPRPQMFSFFLGALVLYLLYLYKYHQRDYLWGLPVVFALWVNLHGGFAIGFIILLGFIIGEGVQRLLDADKPNTLSLRGLGKLALVTGVCVLALALNPYGLRMVTYPFDTAGLQTLNLFIQEWKSPDFKVPQTWPFIIVLLSTLGFAALTQPRLDWSQVSLVTGTALLSLWASRNIALFAVVATPALSQLVDAFLTERGWVIRPMRKIRGVRLLLNWFLLILVLGGALLKIAADLLPENVQEIQGELLPLEAVAYLEDNPPQGNLFNSYNWGGLLIFSLPETPVFVDGRTDLYGDDFLQTYFRAYLGASEWREPLDEYQIQTVLLEEESALGTLLRESGEWHIVYEDEQAVIFERETSAE